MATTPRIKFEHSPADSLADSFISTPGTAYRSLFPEDSMDPTEVMTPQSFEDDSMFGDSMSGSMAGSIAGTPAPDKKPVKKRKSWGQQLPEPKTNLPPRKRAKTEDEKEQRRVERVLRNRRAAQSSRERKRQEVEALENEKQGMEQRNRDLEMRLQDMAAQNLALQQQLEKFTGTMTVFQSGSTVAPSPVESVLQATSPVTFSKALFSSQDEDSRASISTQTVVDSQPTPRTINPASLSPEMKPVIESSNASASLTQYPAVMLCDLLCQTEAQGPWTESTTTISAISQLLAMNLYINMALEATSKLLSPLTQIISSLMTGSSITPTSSILTTILWLVTTTASLTPSNSTISSTTTTTSPRPKFNLRIRMLRRLLACSPQLARPLMDVTWEQVRLASEKQLTRDCPTGVDASGRPDEMYSPGMEALLTLIWTITVIERERLWRTAILNSAKEVREGSEKMDDMFRLFDLRTVSYFSGRGGSQGLRQKSLEGWRPAFMT